MFYENSSFFLTLKRQSSLSSMFDIQYSRLRSRIQVFLQSVSFLFSLHSFRPGVEWFSSGSSSRFSSSSSSSIFNILTDFLWNLFPAAFEYSQENKLSKHCVCDNIWKIICNFLLEDCCFRVIGHSLTVDLLYMLKCNDLVSLKKN